MSMQVVIVGGGKVGAYLAALLHSGGHRVKVVEARPAEAERLAGELPAGSVFRGDGTDPEVLEAAGIRRADAAAAVTGADETNLVVAGLARFAFRVPRTIARIKDPRNAWMFTPEMGIDAALNQADLLAHLIAEEMSLGEMMTLLKLRRGRYSLVEEKVRAGAPAAGRAVASVPLPPECALLAVLRGGDLLRPRGEMVLRPDDEVIALVDAAGARGLSAALGGAAPAGPRDDSDVR